MKQKSHIPECSICDYTTSNMGSLKIHTTSVHEEKKLHKCLFCNFTTSSDKFKQILENHTASVHETNKPHKCSVCNCSFSLKHSLKTHIDSVHDEKKPHNVLFVIPLLQD